MKNLILALLLFPALFYPQGVQKKIRVLFLGNSYTYVNNLPLLVYNIALANGDTLIYDGNLIGGYTLNNHFNDATSLSKINASPWDFVILQAQSQEPSFSPAQVAAQTLPYALKLDSAIKQNNPCATTVFYETWGRKYGDASNCMAYPPVCTYTGMQDRLRQSYKDFAFNCQGIMAPAGEAFRGSIAANPTLELYDPDQSHPSLNGSYLAAAVFYETLFRKSVSGNSYNPGLAVGTLTFLQQTAHTTVHDSLPVWYLGDNFPWAGFSINNSAPFNYQLQTNSPALANSWYFGDGVISSLPNPPHAYVAAGIYTVSHVVTDGCKKDSAIQVISMTASGFQAHAVAPALRVYPDPCTNLLYISGAAFDAVAARIELLDASGRLLYEGIYSSELDTSPLKNGLYFLKVSHSSGVLCLRFIKNE
jgi:hypothetical protein